MILTNLEFRKELFYRLDGVVLFAEDFKDILRITDPERIRVLEERLKGSGRRIEDIDLTIPSRYNINPDTRVYTDKEVLRIAQDLGIEPTREIVQRLNSYIPQVDLTREEDWDRLSWEVQRNAFDKKGVRQKEREQPNKRRLGTYVSGSMSTDWEPAKSTDSNLY